MKATLKRAAIATVATFLAAFPAAACLCNKETRQSIIEAADVVFAGNPVKVTSFKEGGYEWEKTTFRVRKWTKGGEKGGKTVEIYMRFSSCDVRFLEDTGPFTVAAFLDAKGRLTTNRCVMLNIHREQ